MKIKKQKSPSNKKPKKVILDTNIFIEYFKKDQQVIDELKAIGFESIYIPSIVAFEIFDGLTIKNSTQTLAAFEYFQGISFTPEMAILAAQIKKDLTKLGFNKIEHDSMIAATAILTGCEIYT
jgi:predicted nucleic acid-binding protein